MAGKGFDSRRGLAEMGLYTVSSISLLEADQSVAHLFVPDLDALVELGLENGHTLRLRRELCQPELEESCRLGEDGETRPHDALPTLDPSRQPTKVEGPGVQQTL